MIGLCCREMDYESRQPVCLGAGRACARRVPKPCYVAALRQWGQMTTNRWVTPITTKHAEGGKAACSSSAMQKKRRLCTNSIWGSKTSRRQLAQQDAHTPAPFLLRVAERVASNRDLTRDNFRLLFEFPRCFCASAWLDCFCCFFCFVCSVRGLLRPWNIRSDALSTPGSGGEERRPGEGEEPRFGHGAAPPRARSKRGKGINLRGRGE